MGRRGYPPEFRRKVLDLVEEGRSITDVARDLGISAQSIYMDRQLGLELVYAPTGGDELTVLRTGQPRLHTPVDAILPSPREATPPKGGSRPSR